MKLYTLCLGLVALCNAVYGKFWFNFNNAKIWKPDIPKEDFKKNIALQLVRKDWVPKGSSLPNGDEFLPRYTGTVKEAFKIFQKDSDYKFEVRPLEKANELLTVEKGYRSELDSIFVIHTISGNANAYYIKNAVTALALRNMLKRYNVFAFDMPGMQDSMEKTVVKSIVGIKGNYIPLSETIGDFLISAIQGGQMDADKIHFFGFCYSSQLAGYIARYISSKNNGRKIKSITALDPFSVGLYAIRNKVLSKNDAQLVYAYHSNSAAFGSLYRRATADFHLNNGMFQPGCFSSINKNYMCSHRRAVTAFWYMILYPELWLARKCPNWIFFKTCLCNWNKKVPITFPPVPGATGRYYLNTMSQKPYAYGPSGAKCFTVKANKKQEKILGKTKA